MAKTILTTDRIDSLRCYMKKHRLDATILHNEFDILALLGVKCDSANVVVTATDLVFYTDFRYATEIRRVEPELTVRDIKRIKLSGKRLGYVSSISKAGFDRLQKLAPKATFVDVAEEIQKLRAIKAAWEIEKIRRAQKLNREIWEALEAGKSCLKGKSEFVMRQGIISLQSLNDSTEAFSTIASVGANAAECHHLPDDTVWDGKSPLLIDMGLKYGDFCSDITRMIDPKKPSPAYAKARALVQEAHDKAIAAAKPGMTAAELDKVARDVIVKGGFGKCFGHSLGHGVGFEVHEYPTISKKNRKCILKPGMVFTIEPGIYLEGNFGIRIEDMVLITEDGCEVL